MAEDNDNDVMTPHSKQLPLTLRRLPDEKLEQANRALAILDELGLDSVRDIQAIRAILMAKDGPVREGIPLSSMTTTYQAANLWAWTPARWKAEITKVKEAGAPAEKSETENGPEVSQELAELMEAAQKRFRLMQARARRQKKDLELQIKRDAEDLELQIATWKAAVKEFEAKANAKANEPETNEPIPEPQQPAPLTDEQRQELLEQAMPVLENLIAALNCLCSADIKECKCFSNPPYRVALTFRAVLLMLGEEGGSRTKGSWRATLKVLCNIGEFMQRLMNFDKDNISDEVLRKVIPLIKKPVFEVEGIARCSKAAYGLAKWVIGLVEYARVSRAVGGLPFPEGIDAAPDSDVEDAAAPDEPRPSYQARQRPRELAKMNGFLAWAKAQKALEKELELSNIPPRPGAGTIPIFESVPSRASGPQEPIRQPGPVPIFGNPRARKHSAARGAPACVRTRSGTIAIHLGGAGCGMGMAMWERIIAEGSTLHFAENSSGGKLPRAVFVDVDSSGLAGVRSSGAFAPRSLLSSLDVLNWGDSAAGLKSELSDSIRWQMEQCDYVGSFVVTHSAHGSSSSLLPKVISLLGNKLKWSVCLTPALAEAATPVMLWNLGLSLGGPLLKDFDMVTLMDNKALSAACGNAMGNSSHTVQDWNRVAGNWLTTFASTERGGVPSASEGFHPNNLRTIATNLVPYPRMHFSVPSYTEVTTASYADAVYQVTKQEAFLSSLDLSSGKHMTTALCYRGMSQAGLSEAFHNVRRNRSNACTVEWAPGCLFLGGSSKSPSRAELAALTHTGAIAGLISSWHSQGKALDHAEGARKLGVEESQLSEAQESVRSLLEDIESISADSGQCAAPSEEEE